MKFFDFFTKGENNKKMNHLFIVFIIGIMLIILSKSFSMKDNNNPQDTKVVAPNTINKTTTESYEEKLEKRLEKEFSKITGVGDVEVILTLKTSGEIIVNKDSPYSQTDMKEQDSEGGTRENIQVENNEKTVLINGSDGSSKPIILKELEPEVNGIVIIAEGGDDVSVKNYLINAAKVLLDVPAHKIEVLKMAK